MSEMLAQGWLKTSFSTINFYRSKTINPRNHPETEYELYSVPSFPLGEPEIIKGKDVGSSKQVVEPGDVLVCKINPRINRVWQVGNNSGRPQIASSEWIVLKPNHLSPEFLRYQFTENYFRELICTDLTGVGGSLTRAQPKRVATFPVLLAPFEEQKRIVSKLDCLLAKVDACKARLDKVPEIIKRFRQSVLADAVSGKLTEDWREENRCEKEDSESIPNKWRRICLRDISKCISGAAFKKKDYSTSGSKLLQIANVSYGSTLWEKKAYIPFELAKHFPELKLEKGDFVLALNRPITNGLLKIARLSEKDLPATLYQRVGKIELFDKANSDYFYLALQTQDFLRQVEQNLKGSDQPYLNTSLVPNLKINLPPVEEQNEIVKRVTTLLSFVDQLQAKLNLAKKRVDNLTASILSKAFRGELVPQDPNDEPAEVLLNRIRAEREAQAPGKKRSGRKKKTKAQKTDADTEPAPAAEGPAKADTDNEKTGKANAEKQSTVQSDPRFEKSAVLQAFRKAVFHQADLDEQTLLQQVGRRLGVHRLSQQIRAELESHIRTAIRRKIISRNGHGYNPATPTINHYEDEDLIKSLRSVIRKGYEYEREYVATQAAAYLGFDNISEAFAARMKTIFNMAIRRDELYRNGVYVGKV